MTYFPFPNATRGRPGSGEVATTCFAVPPQALEYWAERLEKLNVHGLEYATNFGEKKLHFQGPDGDQFALIEAEDARAPWLGGGVANDVAIRGFHSASMRVQDAGATTELLTFMGYVNAGKDGPITRFHRPGGNGAHVIDVETMPGCPVADQGAGSVHHIAFAVENRAKQLEVRKALLDTGYQVTPVIDRDYFWAIYFRAPNGVLFEIATNEPGFDRDEDPKDLGHTLMLPSQHEHLRERLESEILQPITD